MAKSKAPTHSEIDGQEAPPAAAAVVTEEQPAAPVEADEPAAAAQSNGEGEAPVAGEAVPMRALRNIHLDSLGVASGQPFSCDEATARELFLARRAVPADGRWP